MRTLCAAENPPSSMDEYLQKSEAFFDDYALRSTDGIRRTPAIIKRLRPTLSFAYFHNG